MSTEDRVRAAAEATAASVRQIRPLTLPDRSAVAAELREQRSPGADRKSGILTTLRETWLVPLGAAAVVAAVALTLVTLRHAEAPRQAPAPAGTVGIPRYYAIATEGKPSHLGQKASIAVTVGDVRTGKTLATVALPAVSVTVGLNGAVGVSAAADDRTFVVGRRDEWGDVDYFLLRIAPGTRQAVTVKPLPISETSPGVLLGFAVSPDGRQLAALSVRGNGTTLRIYSVTSGETLRAWTAGTWHGLSNGNLQQPGVSWTADNRQVAFSTLAATGRNTSAGVLVERVIGATEPSGDLASASRVVLKAPANCSSLLLTPDGGTVVCATQVNYLFHPAPVGCGKSKPMFVAYSAATGKRLRVLYRYPGACEWAVYTVLWADASARHVIGESWMKVQGNPSRITDRYGVAAGGKFVKFPVAKHGQWYSGPAF